VGLESGSIVGGRYRTERLLGRGGMGEVWLCTDLDRTVPVAVKAVRPDVLADDDAARLFHGEVVAAARLSHPGIVAVYDLLRDGGATYLVMAYRPGKALSRFADRVRHFSFVHEVLKQIVSALAYAHARGVLHLDIKPDNVIVESRADAVRTTLVDFGIARVRTPGEGIQKWLRRDAVLGTLDYMAPEQCAGKLDRFGPWTDLYSIGAMGFELCAREAPFPETGPTSIFKRLTERAPKLVPAIEGVPSEFVDLCEVLLSTEPSARPTHAADVLHALEAMRPGALVVPDAGDPRPRAIETSAATGAVPRPATPSEAVTRDVLGGGPRTTPQDLATSDTVSLEADAITTAPTLAVTSDRAQVETIMSRESVPRITGEISRESIAQYLDAAKGFEVERDPEPGAYGLFGLRELALIGREDERSVLWEALRSAILEPGVRVVLLEGPAGAGKSRVAREAMERGHELGLSSALQTSWSAEGSGDEGLRGMIENLLDSRGASLEGVKRRLSFWLERSPGRHDAFAREVELLLRPPKEAAPDAGMPLRVAVDAIELAAKRRPVIVWLDDVQWSRGQAASLVRALLDRSRDLPVCVVATAREDEDRSAQEALAGTAGDRGARVAMKQLDEAATRRMVRGLLDVDDELCELLASRAEGNPLFVTQLLADLVREEAVEWREGRYRMSKAFDLSSVPSNIGALWDRRLARSGADRRLLGALALVRDRVSTEVAGELAKLVGAGLFAAIDRALVEGLATRTGGTYAWVHGLLRDHLVATLEATERPTLHAAAAKSLEPLVGQEDVQEERARHLQAAGEREAACACMLDAGAWSERRAENETRRRRLLTLVDWAEAARLGPLHARALAELAHSEAVRGDAGSAERLVGEAVALAERAPAHAAWIHAREGQVARLRGRASEGEAASEVALRVAKETGDRGAEAAVLVQLGVDAMRRDDKNLAASRWNDAMGLYRAAGDRAGEARALAYLGALDPAGRLERFERSIELARAAGAVKAELDARQMRVDELRNLGERARARQEGEALIEQAQRRGLRQTVSLTELQCALCAIEEGQWPLAERHWKRMLAAGAADGALPERAFALALELVLALAAGRVDDARRAAIRLRAERNGFVEDTFGRLLDRARELAPEPLKPLVSAILD
jgi:serine/threonine protein kinase